MIIEKITFNEKNMNFLVELSSLEKLKISYEIYEALELKREMKVSEEIYKKLKEEDSFIKAKEIALRFINYKQRSAFEVERKLRLSKIDQSNIDRTMDFLINKNYLNDTNYAKEYFRQCMQYKNYSLNKTKVKLYEKGIDRKIIDLIIEENYTEAIERENALKLCKKKARNLDLEDFKNKNKVYRYLLSNGFSYDLSKSVLDELSNERKD